MQNTASGRCFSPLAASSVSMESLSDALKAAPGLAKHCIFWNYAVLAFAEGNIGWGRAL